MDAISSYLGPANPSWASFVHEPQLRGLLTLASLVSEHVYLSDVHLGDNRHFADSYAAQNRGGLYDQFEGLAKHGIVRLLLRDASVRPQAGEVFEVHSFSDVYRSWQKQDPKTGWIVPPGDQNIVRFLEDLDSWVPPSIIQRYNYLDQKDIFISEVRAVSSSPSRDSWLGLDNSEPARLLRASYDALIDKDWFSLTDFNMLFQGAGMASDSKPMAFHGLLNEMAYSRTAGCSLVGADLRGIPLEDVFWPAATPSRVADVATGSTPLAAILEHAKVVLEAPDLSVVADLTVDEVLELRESAGVIYFDLMRKIGDTDYIAAKQKDFETQLAYRAGEYWQGVVEYLARHHPSVSYEAGKLAVMVGGQLPMNLTQYASKVLSFAVSVGVPTIAAQALPAVAAQSVPLVQQAQSAVRACLRFLFFHETPELRRIRKVIPDRTWLTKSNALILPS